MSKIVPSVRFKGFKDDWERLKLGEVVEIKDSARISNTLWVSKGVPYLRSSDLENCGTLGELFISDETYQSYKDKTGAPEKDNVLFTSGGKVGVTYHKIDDDPVYVQGGSILYAKTSKSNKLNGMYLKAFFGSPAMTKYIEGASTGVTLKHFTLKPANAAPMILSSLKEQNKIGELFKQLDDIIALHQCMLDQKKSFKKTMLQKMFPQKGERVPKVRFDGFRGDWEEKFLGNEVEFFSGLTYSPKDIVTKNGTLVIRSSNVKNGEIVDADNVYVDSSIVNSEKVMIGDIIVVVRNGSRHLIGKHATVKKNSDNTVIGAFMTGIRSENSNFTNAILDTTQFAIEINKNLGATINQITTGNFKKMNFFFPCNKEQQKIGTFFKQLDDKISIHQKKLENYKQLKKAFLQRMFV